MFDGTKNRRKTWLALRSCFRN